jgi:hypothetical protein
VRAHFRRYRDQDSLNASAMNPKVRAACDYFLRGMHKPVEMAGVNPPADSTVQRPVPGRRRLRLFASRQDHLPGDQREYSALPKELVPRR